MRLRPDWRLVPWMLLGGFIVSAEPQSDDSIRIVREFGDRSLIIVLSPRAPAAGDLLRCVVRVCPAGDERKTIPMARATVMVGLAKEPITYELKPLAKGAVGCSILVRRAETLRFDLDTETEDGGQASTSFEVIAAGPRPSSEPSIREGDLSRDDQRRIMRAIGEDWAELHGSLEEDRFSPADAAERLHRIQRLQPSLARFTPLRYSALRAELAGLADEFAVQLAGLARSAASGDAGSFRTEFRRVDVFACARCHLKFRWGVVGDLSRFPDLTDASVKR